MWQAAKSATVALKGRPRDFSTAPMNSRGASTNPSLPFRAGWNRSFQSLIGSPPCLYANPGMQAKEVY